MAAITGPHGTCFSAIAMIPPRTSIFRSSMSSLQTWWCLEGFKVSRSKYPSQNAVLRKMPVAFAKASSGEMERSVSIRFEDEATITSEPYGEMQLKVSVSVTAVGTRNAFDYVLENLRKSAPPVQGFRRAKGGKSVIPKDVLYQMLGPSRVDGFVVEEIVSSAVLEYVEKESFKVKKNFQTVQSNKELAAMFKAGKDFVFEAILDLEDTQTEAAASVKEN
ncbi:hypothetical protein KP509_26G051300 [Ceratopteris richardii]|uniref:peptidylprolyl isomerase n=1 Tax=Ceratopteris richardii TaxID=49495 RepID=A0A8T2RM77_CERRI|nr:hypothetical protein KP509_26G051300 [Ceratopteris richardii]KAH7297061.1 hypothetical protein KP509_26G051300 [Ceratopteris richardii]